MNFWREINWKPYSELVGTESRKTWLNKLESGFWQKYCSGENGLEIGNEGYTGEKINPIVPNATSVNMNYPNYDGKTLPFEDNSQDFVFSSHVLEHIEDYKTAIQEQFRVTKPDGFIITIVPHQDLYEKKESLPSRYNEDHKRMYQSHTLLLEIFESLPRNSYRIRHLQENDEGHDYTQPDNEHSKGQYEIEMVIQKL